MRTDSGSLQKPFLQFVKRSHDPVFNWSKLPQSQAHQYSRSITNPASCQNANQVIITVSGLFLFSFFDWRNMKEITLPFLLFFMSSYCEVLSFYSFPTVRKIKKAAYSKAFYWPLRYKSFPWGKESIPDLNVDSQNTWGLWRKKMTLGSFQFTAHRKAAIWDFNESQKIMLAGGVCSQRYSWSNSAASLKFSYFLGFEKNKQPQFIKFGLSMEFWKICQSDGWWCPVAKTPGSQCRGPGFNLWSGHRSYMPQLRVCLL